MAFLSVKLQPYPSICTSLLHPTLNPYLIISNTSRLCLKLPVLGASSRRITASSSRNLKSSARTSRIWDNPLVSNPTPRSQNPLKQESLSESSDGYSRFFIISAVSVGFMALVHGIDVQKAMALGPEGPLMEEFWDNVRRYALYALTVSTGALYTIFLPIVELLKNPISAVLIIIILGGSFYAVSQVVSAMVGVTDFSYDYAY